MLSPPCFLVVVVAGEDRAFRAFSTIQDAQSRELSQHHTARRAKKLKIEERELKLEPVVALDACDVSGQDPWLILFIACMLVAHTCLRACLPVACGARLPSLVCSISHPWPPLSAAALAAQLHD